MFRGSAKNIAEIITAHYVPENADNKVFYFYIMHEVITKSRDNVGKYGIKKFRDLSSL